MASVKANKISSVKNNFLSLASCLNEEILSEEILKHPLSFKETKNRQEHLAY